MESLPTELLIHSYWRLMPRQFSMATAYIRCLRTRARMFTSQTCQSVNPYYCGKRFGEHADVSHLTVCRQLLNSNETAFNYTSVPPPIIAKTRRYQSCLARIRSTVALYSNFAYCSFMTSLGGIVLFPTTFHQRCNMLLLAWQNKPTKWRWLWVGGVWITISKLHSLLPLHMPLGYDISSYPGLKFKLVMDLFTCVYLTFCVGLSSVSTKMLRIRMKKLHH